jgi:transketolase
MTVLLSYLFNLAKLNGKQMNNKITVSRLKKKILNAAHLSGEGHIPSAFSILDLLWIFECQYSSFGIHSKNGIDDVQFVLSKGHGCLALYAVLEERGVLANGLLETFGKFESILGGHPDARKVPGVLASTGSLGHGLPFAVGLAIAKKLRGNIPRVFCLVGDGECNEGTIWESALLGAHHKLDNLVCIVDSNSSSTRALSLGSLKNKFLAFGWHVLEIDGHNHEQIQTALSFAPTDQPLAIIANTIKGKGIKIMEHNPEWHHKSPTTDELVQMLLELDSNA